MKSTDQFVLIWLALTSVFAFILFGYDKFRSGQSGSRISEFHLALSGAIGGWPGGLLAMLIFRHKTAKLSFQLKYAVAFFVWAGLIYLYFHQEHGRLSKITTEQNHSLAVATSGYSPFPIGWERDGVRAFRKFL